MTTWWCEHAWLGGDHADEGVLLEAVDGVFTAVKPGVPVPPDGAERLAGLTLPGLANVHSHAFHRAMRGRTQRQRGTFWTWREQMYAVADRLEPDTYAALARAVYAEMALAGITAVGEFHYLHHAAGGVPYNDPNATGHALVAAAGAAGLRITLLDACYLSGGVRQPLVGPQLRFGDGDAERWASRVAALDLPAHARVGAALHSVRAVPLDQMGPAVAFAAARDLPLHVHLSEQRAENEACLEAYGRTPTVLLAEAGALGARTVAVHATHLTRTDIDLLGGAATGVCLCPTTERDLADGIGPARSLFEAGSPLSLGSDSHAVIDLFAEARAAELDERLRTERRGHWSAAELLSAASAVGHAAIGWPDAGVLAPGARADLVSLDVTSVRWAGLVPGTALEAAVFVASAGDVHHVVVDGRTVVADGRHLLVDDPAAELRAAIDTLLA